MKPFLVLEIVGATVYIIMALVYVSLEATPRQEVEGYCWAIVIAIALICTCLLSLVKLGLL